MCQSVSKTTTTTTTLRGHFGSRLPTRNREVYSSLDGSFFWEAPRSASASGGVHLTQPCTRHQRLLWSSSRPFQPCTRHQRLLWSTSRLLLPCTRHKRQWWSTLHPRQPCPKRRRQVWSLSRFQPVHSCFFFSLSLTSVFRCRDTLPDCHWH